MNLQSNSQWFSVVRAANSLILMAIAMSAMFLAIVVLPPITQEFDIGRGKGALPYTLYMIGFSAGNVFMGRMMDRYGMALIAIIGGISLPLGLYIASQATTFWGFAIPLAVLCGFLGGGYAFAPLVADISHWFDKHRGLAVGIVISGSYISGAIWPPILQFWIDQHGWRQCLLMLSAFCAITLLPLSLVYLIKRKHASQQNQSAVKPDWSKPLGFSRNQLQGMICLAGIGCCVAMSMPQIHIVPHSLDLGFTARDGANMLALMLGFGVVSRIVSGWISDRIGGIKTLILGAFLQAAVIFSFLFIDTLTGLYLLSIAFGLSQGGIVPSYAIIIRTFFAPDEAGNRIAYAIVATTLGMAFGGWIAGTLFDLTGSYTLSIINAVLFNLITFTIAVIMLKSASTHNIKPRQSPPHSPEVA